MSPLSVSLGINEEEQIAVTNEGFKVGDLNMFLSSSNFHDSVIYLYKFWCLNSKQINKSSLMTSHQLSSTWILHMEGTSSCWASKPIFTKVGGEHVHRILCSFYIGQRLGLSSSGEARHTTHNTVPRKTFAFTMKTKLIFKLHGSAYLLLSLVSLVSSRLDNSRNLKTFCELLSHEFTRT